MKTLKKSIRPIKRPLFDVFKVSQYEGHAQIPTSYVPVPDKAPLDATFRVADEFMDCYNAEHPAEFLYKSQTLKKALLQ